MTEHEVEYWDNRINIKLNNKKYTCFDFNSDIFLFDEKFFYIKNWFKKIVLLLPTLFDGYFNNIET